MKNIFLAVSLLLLSFLNAQEIEEQVIDEKEPTVQISVYGKAISASLTKNNDANLITIKKGKEGKMVIANPQARRDTSWVRSFMINDEKENSLKVAFSSRIVGFTNTNLKEIYTQAEEGKTYFLYTIAKPKDPKLAASIRVKRVLLCKIVVK